MLRRNLGRTVVLTLLASMCFVAPAGADDEPAEPMLTFRGGGWGHGIGMSQYGAYGRALAGHTHEQILDFYYADTQLGQIADFPSSNSGNDVDVLVEIRDVVAISTPVVGPGPEPGWEVTVRVDGHLLGTSTRPVTARFLAADETNPARWSVQYTDDADPTELCDANCVGAVALTIERTGGSHVVVEQFEDGPNLGRYGHGTIILHPAAASGSCGTGQQFCVINGDMTIEEYLYGLAEVPASWPKEALEAQAVAGRSYAATRIRDRAGQPFDLFDSVSDQVFAGWDRSSACDGQSWCAAVDATAGKVVVHDGLIASTFYSSSNGGHTAIPADVWKGGATLGYLEAKPDAFDDNPANPNGSWSHTYPLADVGRWLNDHDDLRVGTVEGIVVEDVPRSGRVNFASVTVRGSDATVEVSGKRLYDVLRSGCIKDDNSGDDCTALLGTKFIIVSFADVAFDVWFYIPVQWMSGEGITTGVAPNTFAPAQPNTRAELATFLWRFAGKPSAAPHGFVDVVADSFYEDAVAWLAARKITTGTGDGTTFSPTARVTRAEAATFLWRFAGSPTPNAANTFRDVAPGRFYYDAVRWMIEHGITTGKSTTEFAPDDLLTRAEIATFLWRLAGSPDAFADHVELSAAMRVS